METKEDVKIVVSLKHLSNFWRTLDRPLIQGDINLILTWSEKFVLSARAYKEKFVATGTDQNPQFVEINDPTKAIILMTDLKLYVPVVTLSTKNDNKILEQLRIVFNRTIEWKKCRSEMTIQTKNHNLTYLIDPTFNKVNKLFVFSFEIENNRTSFSKYYVPNVQMKDSMC